MPELAEVEYFRRQWNAGIRNRVIKIAQHPDKRVFRGTDTRALHRELAGARLLTSEARGKRMLFRFSNENWLGLHLGMSGKMQTARPDFRPQKHDHLVLYQRERALVFTDARQFGRYNFIMAKPHRPGGRTVCPRLCRLNLIAHFSTDSFIATAKHQLKLSS